MGKRLSNAEFGQLIGVSHSMASRIKSGDRLPSVGTLSRIHEVLDIPLDTLVLAHRRGPESFGRLIRSRLEMRDRAAA